MMETYITADGTLMGVENGRRFRLDKEPACLAQSHPDTGVRLDNQLLFADGSWRESSGVVHRPPPAGGQYPRQLACCIKKYWSVKFEKASEKFKDYKRGISEGYYHRSREVVDELQRLKAVAQGAAREIRKAEKMVERADPSFREKTEMDRRAEAAESSRKSEFMAEVKAVELDV